MNREEVERANVAQLALLFRNHGETKQVRQPDAKLKSENDFPFAKCTVKVAA